MKTTSKLFSIPLKFRGKPFLGLARLSKIFLLLLLKHSQQQQKIASIPCGYGHHPPPPSQTRADAALFLGPVY